MIIIYQTLPRLFGNRTNHNVKGGTMAECGCGKLNDFTADELRRIREMGFTHVWYTGVIRHATQTDYTAYGIPRQTADIVKGVAGSPYAIADYYDIDPDLAVDVRNRMGEWEALVERTHQAGLKVIMDFVPNHVAREYKSVSLPEGEEGLTDENFYLLDGEVHIGSYVERPAKATGNNVFNNHPSTNDWYETVKLNYEHRDTWQKMTRILLFWAAKGVDAFRCDMAEMVPTDFWTYATKTVKEAYPQVDFIGEVYSPGLYREYIRSGFDYLYDKVGMYDCLRDVVSKGRPTTDITWQWQATDDIRNHMLYFLENHDEQRTASDFFCGNADAAVPAVMTALLMQSNPFMVYMGQERGERGMDEEGFSGRDGRTTIFDYWTLQSLCSPDAAALQLEERYRQLLHIANEEQTAREGLFFDLMYVNRDASLFDSSRLYAFLRKAGDELLLAVVNFADRNIGCSVNIPAHAFDFLRLPEGTFEATELLSGNRRFVSLSPATPVSMEVPAYSGCLYKIGV